MPDPLSGIEKRIERVRLADLKLLDVNARYMRHETFQTLVENVRRDGGLTSVPFAAREPDGSYLVLSGNHRVKAAIEAGIEEADVMLTDDDLPEQHRIAIQLSHNALTGEDDPATLRDLYEALEDVDWRVYSGLDDKTLDPLEQVSVGSLSEANLQFQTVTLAMLPNERDRAEAAWKMVRDELAGSKSVWLARLTEHDQLLEALDTAGRSYGVTNIATCLMLVLDVFDDHVQDLQAGYLDGDGEATDANRWVPVTTLTGQRIPAGAASTVQRAIARMQDQGDAAHAWQALELICADYLAGD